MKQEYLVEGQVRGRPARASARWLWPAANARPSSPRSASLCSAPAERCRADAHEPRLTVGTGGVTGKAERARRTREPRSEQVM